MVSGAAGSRPRGGWAGHAVWNPPWGQRCCPLELGWEVEAEGGKREAGRMPFLCHTPQLAGAVRNPNPESEVRVQPERGGCRGVHHSLSAWLPRPPKAWLPRLPRPPKVLDLLNGSAGTIGAQEPVQLWQGLPPDFQAPEAFGMASATDAIQGIRSATFPPTHVSPALKSDEEARWHGPQGHPPVR